MERFQELRLSAQSKISTADHFFTQTYKLVQDPKLLILAVENIFLAMSYAMGALLHYEQTFKRVSAFTDTFNAKLMLYREACEKRYNFDPNYASLMLELKDTILQHKTSPIEFVRHGQFVICNPDYSTKILSLEILKRHIHKAKVFIQQISKITEKNEAIFGRSEGRAEAR